MKSVSHIYNKKTGNKKFVMKLLFPFTLETTLKIEFFV